jgi:hypothetical protein
MNEGKLKEVDWRFLNNWNCSKGATPVTDEDVIEKVASMCAHVSNNLWESKITLFGGLNGVTLKTLLADNISKNAIFDIASTQLRKHRKLWSVVQKMKPAHQSFEFPVAIEGKSKPRYMKIQIRPQPEITKWPFSVGTIALDYHETDQNIEVEFE